MADTTAPAQAPVAQAQSNDPKQPVGTGTQAATPQAGAAKDAAAEAMKKFKVKVDNQELEVDESELIKGYTHGKAAAKRFQEGSSAKKQAEQFIQMMKDKATLFKAIKELGHDPRSLAEEYLAAQIQDELMDPKDKEIKTWKQKAEDAELREQSRLEAIKQAEHDRLKSKYADEFTKTFIDALEKTGLPKTKPMVAEMAKYIKRAADIGYQLSPTDAAKLVKEDKEAEIHGLTSESDAEILAKMLGEKTLQKLRAYDTQRVKDPKSGLSTPSLQPEGGRKPDKDVHRMTPLEWKKFNRA